MRTRGKHATKLTQVGFKACSFANLWLSTQGYLYREYNGRSWHVRPGLRFLGGTLECLRSNGSYGNTNQHKSVM